MRIVKLLALASLSATVLGAQATVANESAAPSAEPAAQSKDPNRITCKRIEVIGSRLQTKRVCRPAAEWDQQNATDRQALERSQTQRWKSE